MPPIRRSNLGLRTRFAASQEKIRSQSTLADELNAFEVISVMEIRQKLKLRMNI